MFFEERYTPVGKTQRYFVLMQIKKHGPANKMCWVVMNFSDVGNSDMTRKPICLASLSFQKTGRGDFSVFGKSSAWYACTKQIHRQKMEPIEGKRW